MVFLFFPLIFSSFELFLQDMVSNTCLQTKGCDHPWLTTLCHVAFQKYCTNWCQYENAAFSKASPDFDFVIIMYFYQLCWHCIILCFKFPRLLGRLHRFARICFLVWIIMHSDFLDHESSRNNIALTDVVPFPRDSECSFFFFYLFFFLITISPLSHFDSRKFCLIDTGPTQAEDHQFSSDSQRPIYWWLHTVIPS